MTQDQQKEQFSSESDLPEQNEAAPATQAAEDANTLESQYAVLQQKFTELEAKHAEVADAYLRAKAETENTRRRAIEDEAKARKFAIESFAESLLPVRDSLETALNTPNQTYESLKEGVETTLKQLTTALERNKVIEIAPEVGDKLDPNLHQAISVAPADQEPNTIVSVLQKGYTITERTLRAAMVIVAAKK